MRSEFYDFIFELEDKGFKVIKYNYRKSKLFVIASKGKDIYYFTYESSR